MNEAKTKMITAKDYINNHLANEIQKNKDMFKVKTGFKRLDKQLGGFLYSGLHCLGAPTSLGKTTFIMQIADFIARQKIDVLFFSLEMGTPELIFRSLTKEFTDFYPDELVTMDKIMYGEMDFEIIKPVIEKYSETIGKYLTIIEGNFDMDVNKVTEIIDEKIKTCDENKKPVIIIDYLQALRPVNESVTSKQNTDTSVIELKRLSRNLDIPVVLVSSYNRTGYDEPANFQSFKESGGIEFTCDTVMALQLIDVKNKKSEEIQQDKAKQKRELELVILKNRRGTAYKKIPFSHIGAKYKFIEEESKEGERNL